MRATYNKGSLLLTGKASEWCKVEKMANLLIEKCGYVDSFCYDSDDCGECYYTVCTDDTIAEMKDDYKFCKTFL